MRTPPLEQSVDGRLDRHLDSLVKPEAVIGRVVEAVLLAVRIVAKVVEARVLRDLLAKVVHAVEEVGQRVALLDVGLEHRAKGALADAPVVALQVGNHLGRRLLFAVPVDGHGADRLRPAGGELGQLGEQRYVGFAEKLHLVAEAPHHGLEPWPDIAELDQSPLEPCALLVGLRVDLAAESQARRLEPHVGRVAGVGEVRQRRRLGKQRFELRPVGEPHLDVGSIKRAIGQLFVIWRDVLPGGVLERLGRVRQSYHDAPAHILQRAIK